MKILQFIASEGWGGAEKIFVELCNELAKTNDVHVMLLRGCAFRHRFDGRVKLLALQSHSTRRNPLLIHEIYRQLKKLQPDIVHTHAAKATELVYLVNKFLKLRHVGTKHNARKGRIFNKMRLVTAVSRRAADSIKSQKGVVPRVIYNGIRPVPVGAAAKDRLFSIAAVGRLDRLKGFDVLISQVKKLPFDFRLSIVGEGEEKHRLQDLIDRLALGAKVTLVGYQENIPQLLRNSHLLVVSSHTEGFSLVLIEGLFYADVVVSTRVGVAEELLPDEFLVEPSGLAARIADVRQNYEKYRNTFQQIKAPLRRRFILPEVAARYLALYDEIING